MSTGGRVGSLVLFVCALFVLDAALYSTLVPLLPHYADTLHLSQSAAGVLTGAYAVGLIPGAAISNRLAARVGVRPTILAGLGLLAVSSVAFGLGQGIIPLIVARAVQGVSCGCLWGGGLTWLAFAASKEHRGGLMGAAMGASTFGTLIGPALGTVALAIGIPAAFTLVAVGAVGLAIWVLGIPAPPRQLASTAPMLAPYRERAMHLPIWLNATQALPFGLLAVLVPLRLSDLGASDATVALTFVLASCIGVVTSPLAGRLSDRHGRLLPIRTGLLLAAPCLIALPLLSSVALVAALTIVFLGVILSFSFVPAIVWLTDQGERANVASAVPATILTVIAVGEIVGSTAGAGLAQATFDAAPYVLVALLNLGTLALLRTAAAAARPEAMAPSIVP